MAFQTDPLINLVIAGLIITGGLGFMVWFDLATQFDKKKKRRLRFHTKLVLFLTAGILLFGTVSTLFTGGTIQERLAISVFQRKCWLAFPNRQHENSWLCLYWLHPSSACDLVYLYPTDVSGWGAWRDGWGLKITTLFVLLVFARSELLGLPHANVAQRTIEARTVKIL